MPTRPSSPPEAFRPGQHVLVELTCRSLNVWNAGPLCRSLQQSNPPDARISLYLGMVGYVTAAGLAELIALHRSLTLGGGRLTLCEPNDLVADILSVTGLDRLLDVRPTSAALTRSMPA